MNLLKRFIGWLKADDVASAFTRGAEFQDRDLPPNYICMPGAVAPTARAMNALLDYWRNKAKGEEESEFLKNLKAHPGYAEMRKLQSKLGDSTSTSIIVASIEEWARSIQQ